MRPGRRRRGAGWRRGRARPRGASSSATSGTGPRPGLSPIAPPIEEGLPGERAVHGEGDGGRAERDREEDGDGRAVAVADHRGGEAERHVRLEGGEAGERSCDVGRAREPQAGGVGAQARAEEPVLSAADVDRDGGDRGQQDRPAGAVAGEAGDAGDEEGEGRRLEQRVASERGQLGVRGEEQRGGEVSAGVARAG